MVYTLDNFDNNDGWIHKFNNYGSFLAVVLIVMHHNGVQLAGILLSVVRFCNYLVLFRMWTILNSNSSIEDLSAFADNLLIKVASSSSMFLTCDPKSSL